MSSFTELHVNLGRAARGVHNQGLNLDQACPEITDLGLTGSDVTKVERGVMIAISSNSMAERLSGLAGQFPPYGLMKPKDSAKWSLSPIQNFDDHFEVVDEDPALSGKNPDSQLPSNYGEILSRFTEYMSSTMLYALHKEASSGNPAVLNLPHVVDPEFGDPVRDIDRGIGTSSQAMINVLHTILLHYQIKTGILPTYGMFRSIALGSTDTLLILSTLNADIAQRAPMFFDEDYTEASAFEFFKLDLEKRKLEFTPEFNVLISAEHINYQLPVTTGCPARISLHQGKPSPILEVYRRLVDIVA